MPYATTQPDQPHVQRLLARIARSNKRLWRQHPEAAAAEQAECARSHGPGCWTPDGCSRASEAIQHSLRFRQVANGYPRTVSEAYGGKLAQAMHDDDAHGGSDRRSLGSSPGAQPARLVSHRRRRARPGLKKHPQQHLRGEIFGLRGVVAASMAPKKPHTRKPFRSHFLFVRLAFSHEA